MVLEFLHHFDLHQSINILKMETDLVSGETENATRRRALIRTISTGQAVRKETRSLLQLIARYPTSDTRQRSSCHLPEYRFISKINMRTWLVMSMRSMYKLEIGPSHFSWSQDCSRFACFPLDSCSIIVPHVVAASMHPPSITAMIL